VQGCGGGSLAGGGSALSSGGGGRTSASEARFHLVRQLLVRTFDGLDPAAQTAFGGPCAPPVWHGLPPAKQRALDHARAVLPPRPAPAPYPEEENPLRGDDDDEDDEVGDGEESLLADPAVSPPARTRVGLPKPLPPPPRPPLDEHSGGRRHPGSGRFGSYNPSVDPLMPFPTLTRVRGLHARTLPLVSRSDGFLSAFASGSSGGSGPTTRVAMGPGAGRAAVAALRPERLAALPPGLRSKLREADLARIDGAIARGVDALLRTG
jgi:hypothetical protein